MSSVTMTNGAVLDTLQALANISTTNALVAVKLERLRRALEAEAASIRVAFDGVGQRHAVRGEGDVPTVQQSDGQPLHWRTTGTPFYELADAAAFQAEVDALLAGEATVPAPILSDQDLSLITVADASAGRWLLAFTPGA